MSIPAPDHPRQPPSATRGALEVLPVVRDRCRGAAFDVVLVNQPLGWRAARYLKTAVPHAMFLARSHAGSQGVPEARAFLPPRRATKRLASAVLRAFLQRHNLFC